MEMEELTPAQPDELETLADSLHIYLAEFLADPTGKGYHFLRNKIAEYYSISAARTEQVHEEKQEKLRQSLGICRPEGGI